MKEKNSLNSSNSKRNQAIYKSWTTLGYLSASFSLYLIFKKVTTTSDLGSTSIFSYAFSLIVFIIIRFRIQNFSNHNQELNNQNPLIKIPDFKSLDVYLLQFYVTSIVSIPLSIFFPSFILFITVLFRILLIKIVEKIPKVYFNALIYINAVLILAAVLKTGTHLVSHFIKTDGKFTEETPKLIQEFSQIIALILLFLIFNAILSFVQNAFNREDPIYYLPYIISLIALTYMNSFIYQAMNGENVFAFLTEPENIDNLSGINQADIDEQNVSIKDFIVTLLVFYLFIAFLPEIIYYFFSKSFTIVQHLFNFVLIITQKILKHIVSVIYFISNIY